MSKRILGTLNWLFLRKNEFSTAPLAPLPALLRSLKVDWVVFGGDFTTTALPEEFEIAADFVKRVSQPWIAIPGNHDKYTYRSDRNKHFYRYFATQRKEIAQPVDFFTLKDQGVEAHRLSPGWWIVALDTALATNPYSSEGLFSEKLESYLKEVLSLIPESDSIILLNHFPFFSNDEPRRQLVRREALRALIEQDPRIRLYLNGHTHRNTIADLQPSRLPVVLDSGSCTQTKRASWNLIDLKERGCTVQSYKWIEGWTPDRREEFEWK